VQNTSRKVAELVEMLPVKQGGVDWGKTWRRAHGRYGCWEGARRCVVGT